MDVLQVNSDYNDLLATHRELRWLYTEPFLNDVEQIVRLKLSDGYTDSREAQNVFVNVFADMLSCQTQWTTYKPRF